MTDGAVVELRPRLTPGRVWWLASRPSTLAASVSPVLVGTACALHADPTPRLGAGLLATVVAIAIQVGVNYANDYSDFRRGADTPQRRGPVRAAASGVVRPAQVKQAAIAAFVVAAAAGLVLSLITDPRLLLAGALAILAGWLYTGGPRPYGYLGLGEIFVFVFFGLMATCGTTYVEAGRITPLSVVGAVAMGSLACAILVLNNLRDIETDARAGKRTLAVRMGARWTRRLLGGLLLVALLTPVLAYGLGYAGRWIVWPVITFPLALTIWRLTRRDDAKTLVDALKRTAQLEAWFALLWAAATLAS